MAEVRLVLARVAEMVNKLDRIPEIPQVEREVMADALGVDVDRDQAAAERLQGLSVSSRPVEKRRQLSSVIVSSQKKSVWPFGSLTATDSN